VLNVVLSRPILSFPFFFDSVGCEILGSHNGVCEYFGLLIDSLFTKLHGVIPVNMNFRCHVDIRKGSLIQLTNSMEQSPS
jgi:hypothetical protein